MKKTQILNIFNLILFVCLILSLIFCYFVFNEHFSSAWYTIIIFIYAIRLYIKFWLFKSDNVLWFALVLTGIVIFIVMYNYFHISIKHWPILAQIPCMSSGILYMIFKNHLHLYLNILINIITSPLFLISMGIGNLWTFFVIEILAIVIAIAIVNFINIKFRKG